MKTLLSLIILFAIAAAATAADKLQPVARTPFKLGPAGLRPANNTTNGETEILSKTAYFDLKSHTAIYTGDVRVRDPRMELSCEILTVKLAPEGGGKFQNIVAENAVTLDIVDEKGQRIHGTGSKAVYSYSVTGKVTNDVMELSGSPILQNAQGTWAGDSFTLDRASNTIRAKNSRMIIQQSPGSTNSTIPAPLQ